MENSITSPLGLVSVCFRSPTFFPSRYCQDSSVFKPSGMISFSTRVPSLLPFVYPHVSICLLPLHPRVAISSH